MLSICAVLLASQADGAGALGAKTFEELTVGRVYSYLADGQTYGMEQYLPGRRVIWSFLDGECKHGHWYPEGKDICFVYEGSDLPQCWAFATEAGALTARFQPPRADDPIYRAQESTEEMHCPGPEVGV